MTESYLMQLVKIAARIIELEDLEDKLTNQWDQKDAKGEYDATRARFDQARNEFVDALLQGRAQGDRVAEGISSQLASLRANADPSWHRAIDFTDGHLLPYLEKEEGKSPRMRKVLKAAPFVAAGLTVALYFGLRVWSGAEVTSPIESKEGLIQRAFALEKVIRYDEWSNTRVRRGGWLKGIFLWPIEPTDGEVAGAKEFATLAFQALDFAYRQGMACNIPQPGIDDTPSDQEVSFLNNIAEYIEGEEVPWEEPPIKTLLAPIRQMYPCI